MAIENRPPPTLNYALIFNASRNCLAFTEKGTGVILDVNDRWVNATGIHRSDAIGRTALELGLWINPAERAFCMKAIQEESALFDFEVLFNFKGVAIPYSTSGQLVKTDQGECVLWELQNMVEKSLSGKEMLRTQVQLQSILEATPIPLFVKDADSRLSLIHI